MEVLRRRPVHFHARFSILSGRELKVDEATYLVLQQGEQYVMR
jgi:hypothetical protein